MLMKDQNIPDPFRKKNNILTPLLLTLDLAEVSNVEILFSDESGYVGYSGLIQKLNLDLVINVKSNSSSYRS